MRAAILVMLAFAACRSEDPDPSGEEGDGFLQMEDQQDQLMGVDPTNDGSQPARPPDAVKYGTVSDATIATAPTEYSAARRGLRMGPRAARISKRWSASIPAG